DRSTGLEITELLTQNVGDGQATGLEVELSYAVTTSFLFQANVGLLDTKYTNVYDRRVTLQTEFARAPDETYNFGFQYDANLSKGGGLVTRFDFAYTGGYWRSTTPSLRRNAYGVPNEEESGDYWNVNARMTYTPPNSRYEVSLYGTNLTNDYHLDSGF